MQVPSEVRVLETVPGSPLGGWRGCDRAVPWSGPGGEAIGARRVVVDSGSCAEVVWKRGPDQGRPGFQPGTTWAVPCS